MSDSLETYLNDHLGGATLGCEHARQLEELAGGTALGDVMARLAPEIEADRDDLKALMARVGADESAVKKAGAWLAQQAGRPKFSGATSGDKQLGIYLALETLSLGVAGKLCLWEALLQVQDKHPALAEADLERLATRAKEQRATLEEERLKAAVVAF